jgi:hypothetical protein
METWIVKRIRETSRYQIIAWSLATAALLLWGISEQRYVNNFLFGPFEVGDTELKSIRAAADADHYFVKVTGSKVLETGIQNISISKEAGVETSRKVSGAYYALVVGRRLLIVRSGSMPPNIVEGELKPIPNDVDQLLFGTNEMQRLRPLFYSYYVSDDAFRLPGYAVLGGLLIFCFALIKYGRVAWLHWGNPRLHPVIKRVESWGDTLGIAAAVETEAKSPFHKGRNGWLVTDKYFIQSGLFTFDLLRISDLLWAYKKVTRHSVNFIPTGKTYDAVLTCYGGSAVIQAKQNVVDAILLFATERAPWAAFGFTKELEELFRKKTRDFCSAIEQRKSEYQQNSRSS